MSPQITQMVADESERWKWLFTDKHFSGGLIARLRAFYYYIIRRYQFEICGQCGRSFPIVWWAIDDETWLRVNGAQNGSMCVPCFDRKAQEMGIHLRWEAKPLL